MTEKQQRFELDPQSYDALVDWPRRLANEEAFYRRVFGEAGVGRVLDAACGTGHHAALFASWGLRVEGADAEPAMIEYCRATHGESERLGWAVRSFDEPAAAAGFDAVICVGNSLALAGESAAVRRAVRAMLASLRPGGVGIIQVLNLWALPEGPVQWQKCKRLPAESGERILLKGVHRVANRGYVSFVEVRSHGDKLEHLAHGAVFNGIPAAELVEAVGGGGGRDLRLYGSFRGDGYDEAASSDLVATFRAV